MGQTDLGGKLGLVLMGGAMVSKSLIQFSIDGWSYVPSLLFTWGQTMVGIMATSSKRTYASMPHFSGLLYSVSLTLQEVTVNPCTHQRLSNAHRQVKTSGGDGIPAELFKILKDDAINLENLAVATDLEKVSFHSNPKERNAKECSNYCTIALISHASKVMLQILQARLQ